MICRFESDIRKFRVTAAEHDISQTDEFEQRRKVAKIILHPGYDGRLVERLVENGWLLRSLTTTVGWWRTGGC